MSDDLIRKMILSGADDLSKGLRDGKHPHQAQLDSMRAALMVLADNVTDDMALEAYEARLWEGAPRDPESLVAFKIAVAAAIREAAK